MVYEDTGFLYADSKSEFSDTISRIYERLGDDISRIIFSNRLLFSLTNDPQYMRPVIATVPEWNSLYNQIADESFDIYIYGAGRRGKRLVDMFPEVNWRALVDSNPKIREYHGRPVIHPSELKIRETTKILVSVLNGYEEIEMMLTDQGAVSNQILILNHFDVFFSKEAYFDKSVLDLVFDPNKYFVDAGCYDGKDTIRYLNYIRESEKRAAKVIAFEPDYKNYLCCKENLKRYPKVMIRNTALYSSNTNICMDVDKGEQSKVTDGTGFQVKGEKLDDILGTQKVGLIKMDIEGSEIEALKGTAQIISIQHPILAISVYHKKSDIWNIPGLILKYFSQYQLYLRHYNASFGETILYAVPL